ncbi:MAG: cation-translocating P-type ATPase [Oscillospiraceae bacterium]|jgi:magnesium-transporting ATPase (P-type)|nr:cation-translocating P-type ATPase [Oscillospiraceae bacterium]
MEFKGLTSEQVADSRKQFGSNSLSEKQQETFVQKWLANLTGDAMIRILLFALVLNIIFYILKVAGVIEADIEWYESAGIAAAVLIATLVSTFSEFRNEQSFRKLQEEASRIKAKAYRDGVLTEILVDDIVQGDFIRLESGDKISADGTVIWGDIKVEQSALNGESEDVRKLPLIPGAVVPGQTEKIDWHDNASVYRGSVVTSGAGVMQVTVVGDKSMYGKIAQELQEEDDRDSPLKVKLSGLADGIAKFGYIGGALIAVAFFIMQMVNFEVVVDGVTKTGVAEFFSSWVNPVQTAIEAVILAVIIIVMAVPEGLPLMIAIVSALNMGKMLKDNVLVRNREGIETAGSLNILFSDKTGTITKGKLETVLFAPSDATEYKNITDIPTPVGKILSASLLCNTTAVINHGANGVEILGGNATERAVVAFAAGRGYDAPNVTTVANIPFNSTNKYSATQVTGDIKYTLIKGAPEKIITNCKYAFNDTGRAVEFTDKSAINAKIDELAARAIRVLAVAVATEPLTGEALSGNNWVMVGILGIRDEVRPESVEAIAEVKKAGVQVVMITGDRKDTAVAIAKDAKLLENSDDKIFTFDELKDQKDLDSLDGEVVLTSDELAEMSDEQIKSLLPKIRVISRALPTDKSRLVRVSQELNLVVGMTGDGVNDSPALKKADVGFGMGGGTEVAKEASDIVILDDNFSSIDKAILYGRTIFNSIRKFIIFQLTINVAAVITSFVAPFLGIAHPLSITQILWVNLVMDTLAALAFGGEPALKRFMKEKPKRRDEQIVSRYMWSEIFTGAAVVFLIGLVFMKDLGGIVSEFFRMSDGVEATSKYWLTGYFAFFIFAAVFNAFNARTEKINVFDNIGKNSGFFKILCIIVVVQILMTYLGGEIFKGYGLNAQEWIFVLVAAIIIVPVDMLRKAIIYNFKLK